MALQALKEYFWPGDGQVNDVPVVHSPYKNWQVVVLYGGFGVPIPMPRRLAKLATRLWAWIHRDLCPERLYIFCRLVQLLFGPHYGRAREVVRQVAVTPGLADKRAWGEIGNKAGMVPTMGENLFRHMAALNEWGPFEHKHWYERNVLLELAWLALKERHR